MNKMILFLFSFLSLIAEGQVDSSVDTASRSAITKIGKPAGKISAKKIGRDGGALASGDGVVELSFPEGALSKNTVISIQPVMNLVPNGIGAAYRLEPSGIKFSRPAQIIFHYDPEESAGNVQALTRIGMQDETGQWFGLNHFSLDTVNKTISGAIGHFSTWATFSELRLHPSPEEKKRVKVNKNVALVISGVTPSAAADENDELSQLDNWKAPRKGVWRVNDIVKGNAVVGTLVAGAESEATMSMNVYTAPSKVPDSNPVAVSIDLVGASVHYKNAGTFKNLTLVTHLLVYDNAYEVSMITSIDGMAGSEFGKVAYKDTGSFVVSLNGKDTRIIEKVNKNTNAELDYNGKCVIRILKPGSGNIHLLGAQTINVTPSRSQGSPSLVEIMFKRTPAVLTLLQATCPDHRGSTTMTNAAGIAMMAAMAPAYPQYIKFEAREGEQVIEERGTPGSELYIKTTVTQLKDE